MITNLEAKATILFANRARRVLDALNAAPKVVEPEPPPKEPKETRAQRREKEKFGEHPRNRRITGLTYLWEENVPPKDRRKGLKRLVKTLKEEWNASPRRHGDTEKGDAEAVCHGQQSGCPCARGEGDADAVCHGQQLGCPCARGEDNADAELRFSLTAPWERDVAAWELPCNAGRSIEDICVDLQMSRARLTTLTKEYCGLTAQELIDGFRISKLKNALVVRLRAAARKLWGPPGSFVWTKLEDVPLPEGWVGASSEPRASASGSTAPLRSRLGDAPKHSMFFRTSCEDYYKEERGDEIARRTAELIAQLRDAFEIEAWAVHLGFASAARLKRACLTVLGRTIKQLERILSAEVVRYYLCVEEKAMRELACRDDQSAITMRARLYYWRSEDKPTAPFLDEWSKYEVLARDWLIAMYKAYG